MYLLVSEKASGYDRLYSNKGKTTNRIIAKDIDVLIPRLAGNLSHSTSILRHFRNNLGIYTANSPEGIINASNKLKTLQLCSAAGLKTPKTIMVDRPKNIDAIIKQIGLPIVVKFVSGSKGYGVSILETKLAAKSTIESFHRTRSKFLIQKYIESNGTDIRAFIVDGEVIASYERKAPKNDFRSNLSSGGSGKKINLTQSEKDFCVTASKAVGLNISGVDIIKSKSGYIYLIEVNSNPGFKGQKITGVNFTDKIIRYVEQQYPLWQKNRKITESLCEVIKHLKSAANNVDRIHNKGHYNMFQNDTYLREIIKNHKGEKLNYIDRNGSTKHIIIRSVKDLQKVMLESFIIKN